MKWIEAKVFYDACHADAASELIAMIFDDFGLQGVVMESPEPESADGWFDDSVILPSAYAVTGYFPKNDLLGERVAWLQKRLTELETETRIPTRLELTETNEEDWAESWKAFFFPEKISRFFVVKPTWREYQPKPGELVIEIDPGMAFGTGAHPTTRLCVQMIETYLNAGNHVLDIGAGSGILMIAAAKLGAETVVGIDRDEVAAETAQKNLTLNHIGLRCFRLIVGNLTDGITGRFDLVVANILTETVIDLLDNLGKVMAHEGIFICSGIIDQKQAAVSDKMKRVGFDILSVLELDSWVCIAGKYCGQP